MREVRAAFVEKNFTTLEQIIVSVSRLIRDGDVVFAGVGVVNVSAVFLAKLSHAPDITILFETGIIRTDICRLPYGLDDLYTQNSADMLDDLFYVNCLAQRGLASLGLLSAGQIDRFGNLNTSCLGDHAEPWLRFPGSGGASDILGLCRKTIYIIPKQTKGRLPEHVDFISGVGYLDGTPGIRSSLALPSGTGPSHVITDLGAYSFQSGEMVLETLHHGVSLDEVMMKVGWSLKVAASLQETSPPTGEELRILRKRLCPEELYRSGMDVL
jgi:glutaconate CoA-transferase, subunit B